MKKILGIFLILVGLGMGVNTYLQQGEVSKTQEIIERQHDKLRELVPETINTEGDSESLLLLLDSDYMQTLRGSNPQQYNEIKRWIGMLQNEEKYLSKDKLARMLSALISLAALAGAFLLLRKKRAPA